MGEYMAKGLAPTLLSDVLLNDQKSSWAMT